MPRRVGLVLSSDSGVVLGVLQEFIVDSPWWPDVQPVVEAARTIFGVDVLVLRLLTTVTDQPTFALSGVTEGAVMEGGAVTYLAELVGQLPPGLALTGVDADLVGDDQPLRAAWARPGGVAATIAWADAALAVAGRPRTGDVVQVKSWNLSSIIRLPTLRGDVWCKSVPPFEAHEGTIMALVAADDPSLVPTILGSDRAAGTVLLADVPGEDQWVAPETRLIEMVRRLVRLQADWARRTDELLVAGASDWRGRSLPARFETLLGREDVRVHFSHVELLALDALLADLAPRLEAISACGLPETLVHGDFHPGNWRFGPAGLVLLDWGDSGVGHPMFDFGAFLPRVPAAVRQGIREAWFDAWYAERPASNPALAAELIRPVSAVRNACIYQGFLDGIEPSERPYHAADVPYWLRRAIADG